MFEDESLDELIRFIDEDPWPMPVRVMEAVLARGPAAVAPVREMLRRNLPEEDGGAAAAWASVLLGEIGDPAAVPDLAAAIAAAPTRDIGVLTAAADALAKLGTAALPALRALAASEPSERRIWVYWAAGRMPGQEAGEWLADALDADPEMRDVVALALADHGDRRYIEPLARTLAAAEPWQRPDIEDAIGALHRGDEPASPRLDLDWRLRYRPDTALSGFPLSWAAVTAIVREDERARENRTGPLRRLDEVLREADEPVEQPETCDCCDTPIFRRTGAPVCPATAAAVASIQADLLDDLVRDGIEDLFDVLDVVEIELGERPKTAPRGRRAREQWENEGSQLGLLRAAAVWLIGQGIETLAEGRATLLVEAADLTREYGDPFGALEPAPRHRSKAAGVGRNDPCPCGSGRKHKKCCGARGSETAGAGGSRSMEDGFDPDPGGRRPGGPGSGSGARVRN